MKRINQIKEALYKDEQIKKFLDEHQVEDEVVLDFMGILLHQKENNRLCKKCMGLIDCLMDVEGMQSHLEVYDSAIKMHYHKCPYFKRGISTLEYLYFPDNVDHLEPLIQNKNRQELVGLMVKFGKEYKKGQFTKGIYVSGPFGSGKTFSMIKLAKSLAEKGVKVLYVYYPDWIRHIKSSIGTNTLEQEMDRVKNAEVVFLDDVGAESNSAFVRDEVLGALLQYRMFGNLPTCMTSNSNLTQLTDHLMETKTEVNKSHSGRIIERIRYMMQDVELTDMNYRDQSTKKKALNEGT